MPWALHRFQNSGHLHFITFSCRHRQQLLGRPESRTTFQQALEAMRIRSAADIYGYVVMPEHVHLLLSEPRDQSLAAAIQGLKQATAHFIGPRNCSLWDPRYHDFNVLSNYKRVEKLRYLHRNPVRRGLVADPGDWQWSSFHQYATHEAGIVRLVIEADPAVLNRAAHDAHPDCAKTAQSEWGTRGDG
jgi:putative transposase